MQVQPTGGRRKCLLSRPRRSQPKSPELAALGQAIRELRERAGLTQEDLALAADLDPARIGSAEIGRSNLTVLTQFRICRAMGISYAELAARTDQLLADG